MSDTRQTDLYHMRVDGLYRNDEPLASHDPGVGDAVVTPEMITAGCTAYLDCPHDHNPRTRTTAPLIAAYRAMHRVAPVELVSEGERLADEAYGYLRRIFEHLAPQCTPLPDLIGICTQVDNVLAGVLIERDEARAGLSAPTEYWDGWRTRALMLEAALRSGITPPGEADGRFGHLIWWPDELPVPWFTGPDGDRRLGQVVALDEHATKLRDELDETASRASHAEQECIALRADLAAERAKHTVPETPVHDFTRLPTRDPRRMGLA